MITAEMSRFMDEDVHRNAYLRSLFRSLWMGTMNWHFDSSLA